MGVEKVRRRLMERGQQLTESPELTAAIAAAVLGLAVPEHNQVDDDYTLVEGDIYKVIEFIGDGTQVLTVPRDASLDLPVGTRIPVLWTGTGAVQVQGEAQTDAVEADPEADPPVEAVEFVEGCDVHYNTYFWYQLAARYSEAWLRKIGPNSWLLTGELAVD